MGSFEFNPAGFAENLTYMGVGMLGVFIIVGVILGIRNYLTSRKAQGGQHGTQSV